MKFRFGAWMWEKGVTPHCAKRVTFHRVEADALFLAAVDRSAVDGINRCEGTVLQIRLSSPMPDVVRVQVKHHHSHDAGVRAFELDYRLRSPDVEIRDDADELIYRSGKLSLRIRKDDWSMRFEDQQASLVTGGGAESLAYVNVAGQGPFMMQRLSLSVGECIYGMGERFGPVVKNGQSVAIWNEDGGTVSDIAYKNVPFYLSSRGYGVLVNTPAKVEFETCTERVSQMQFAAPGEELDYYLFYGPAPKEVLEKYTRLSGRPAVPPAWSFGLWLSTSFTTRYDEGTVNEFVDGMAERGIPLEVFHFDCFWMKERQWCDFEWDREAFPDPLGMIQRLKNRGLKICVWINPYISGLSKLFDEGRRQGYFIRRTDGGVWQTDLWQPGMAVVDFTNPRAVAWYQSKLRGLLEMGVDCFKTDFGERIPAENVMYHDGADPKLMHNYYPYLYNRAVFELLEEHHGKGNALVFARSATAGSQKFPVHWGGDCEATFESMAEDLRGGLSFCLSGAAFWSHDIGGFEGTANAACYKRWVAFGLLSTHSRLHGSGSYRVPWLFDDESVEVMRHFTKLKNQLLPYLYSAAHDANQHGWPVMRAMMLEFPDDPGTHYLDRQYMLGSSFLVAPVFRPDDIAEYYLPRGRWTHWLSGEVIEGGCWRQERLGFMQIPLYARENSIIPVSTNGEHPRWTQNDPLVLHLVQIADGAEVRTSAFSSQTREQSDFVCRRSGDVITLHSEGALAPDVQLMLRSKRAPAEVSNGSIIGLTELGTAIHWHNPREPMILRFGVDGHVEVQVAPTARRRSKPRAAAK